jgi:hypothetical protein
MWRKRDKHQVNRTSLEKMKILKVGKGMKMEGNVGEKCNQQVKKRVERRSKAGKQTRKKWYLRSIVHCVEMRRQDNPVHL